jgi:hypothetical protein
VRNGKGMWVMEAPRSVGVVPLPGIGATKPTLRSRTTRHKGLCAQSLDIRLCPRDANPSHSCPWCLPFT